MKVFTLDREQVIKRPISTVFGFFSEAANLQELTPPWLHFAITQQPKRMQSGARLHYQISWHGVPISWETNIVTWDPPHSFIDEQVYGPYALWRHRHTFKEVNGGVQMTDHVDYALPLGPLGALAHIIMVRKDVSRIFDYRREKVAQIFP